MDKVFIEALEVDCTIGVHDWERRIRQPIVLELEIGFDCRKPAASDALEDTVDYAEVIGMVRAIAAEGAFMLIESLAESVCERVLRVRGVRSVSLRATKHVPSLRVGAVGVVIHREKDGG